MTGRLSAALQTQWWRPRPSLSACLLLPLAWLYQALAGLNRAWQRRRARGVALGRPVVVVGNLVVGGAGKTPTVVALVEWLRSQGWHPGVVSRGHGRADADPVVEVRRGSPASEVGDEPLLMHRRTGAPVVVGRNRLAAARALLAAHPEVDLLLSDDGLQHLRLPRDVEIVVFDERGAGNGLTLPAGPLREPLPASWPARRLVLYNAPEPSTALPGACVRRSLGGALALEDWWQGRREATCPLGQLRGRPLTAAAGTGAPERFFSMLDQAGLAIRRLPLPDHASFDPLPWPEGTAEVVVTEKDAVKLVPGHTRGARVWVVALDFALPGDFTAALQRRLPRAPAPDAPLTPR